MTFVSVTVITVGCKNNMVNETYTHNCARINYPACGIIIG